MPGPNKYRHKKKSQSIMRGVVKSLKNRKRKSHKKKIKRVLTPLRSRSRTRSNTRSKSSTRSKSRTRSRSRTRTRSSVQYNRQTRKAIYTRARSIKRSNAICYQPISKMKKHELINFMKTYDK
jgi:hypothetical protein